MKPVDILRDDGNVFCLLQFCDELVGIVWLCLREEHLFLVELEKLFRLVFVEGM